MDMLDKLLLEKIPIAGISSVTGILEPCLQRYINRKYGRVPHAIDRSKKRPSHGRVWWNMVVCWVVLNG